MIGLFFFWLGGVLLGIGVGAWGTLRRIRRVNRRFLGRALGDPDA